MRNKWGVKPAQAEVLEELEAILDRNISCVEKIDWNTIGVKVDGDSVIGLGLSRESLTMLPESLGNLKSLQELRLYGTKLKYFPEQILKLKSLQRLYLEGIKLMDLPASFGILNSLRVLGLGGNMLATLPKSFGDLDLLEYLDLESNHLSTFPLPIVDLKSLQILNLDYNHIEALPESIRNLKSLKELSLAGNWLNNLPEAFGQLESLQELRLDKNRLTTLPESFSNLDSLQSLYLDENELTSLPDSFGNLKNLESLSLAQDQLTNLPESFGNLKSIRYIKLIRNKLRTLPESIGKLETLQKLDLRWNKITSLPKSIGNLISLKELDLQDNQIKTLPISLWSLKNLKKIELDGNPWEGEWKELAKRDASSIIEYCRKRANIHIFISHAVTDFNYFHVNEIAEYLEQQKEIYQVYYCEEDLRGNIDEFMNETIPKCQLLLFFASKKSVFDSKDCGHELELARRNEIQIIPIKGKDLKWENLVAANLSREMGFEFNEDRYDKFCDELYQYIKQYKRDINLFEPEQAKIDKQMLNTKNMISNFIESNEYKRIFKENIMEFKKIFHELSINQISIWEYLQKWFQILSKKYE